MGGSAVKKIKKLSETTATVPIVVKLCMNGSKGRAPKKIWKILMAFAIKCRT